MYGKIIVLQVAVCVSARACVCVCVLLKEAIKTSEFLLRGQHQFQFICF